MSEIGRVFLRACTGAGCRKQIFIKPHPFGVCLFESQAFDLTESKIGMPALPLVPQERPGLGKARHFLATLADFPDGDFHEVSVGLGHRSIG